MSRSGSYGMSFARKALEAGDLPRALEEANRAIARDAEDSEAVYERALVYAAMDRHDDAVADLERAIDLDAEAQLLDDAAVDDTLFSTLLAFSRALAPTNVEEAVAVLRRYGAILPKGSHGPDVATWEKRLRGESPTSWTKKS